MPIKPFVSIYRVYQKKNYLGNSRSCLLKQGLNNYRYITVLAFVTRNNIFQLQNNPEYQAMMMQQQLAATGATAPTTSSSPQQQADTPSTNSDDQ